MFDRLQLIDLSGPLMAVGIDGVAHLDLCIDAAIEAVVSHRLGPEQYSDADQAEGSECRKHWVGMVADHVPGGQRAGAVVAHDSVQQAWRDSSTQQPLPLGRLISGLNETHFCADRPRLCAWARSRHQGPQALLRDAGQQSRVSPIVDLSERMLSRSRTVKS